MGRKFATPCGPSHWDVGLADPQEIALNYIGYHTESDLYERIRMESQKFWSEGGPSP